MCLHLDIAERIDEPYEVIECSSIFTEALNHVAIFIGLTLVIARNASQRRCVILLVTGDVSCMKYM